MRFWTDIEPALTGCLALAEVLPDLPAQTLLHAGPAFEDPSSLPRPVRNAAVATVLAEGWCGSAEVAEDLIAKGEIRLVPAQDHGVVTPLACVVSPSMPVLAVAAGGVTRFAPLNDGPPPGALRFGTRAPEAQQARIAQMRAVAEVLSPTLTDGIPLLPLMARALDAGDDLHGSVVAMSRFLAERLGLSGEAGEYTRTPLFALNPVMAAASAMLQAAAPVSPVPMVIAAGGNGVDFGWITSDHPGQWQRRPALPPVGPRMDGGTADVLPAIGDSAVIDALGLGGPSLRHAPELCDALAEFHPRDTFTPCPAFLAPHPGLPGDIRLGLPASRLSEHPGIMLAMLGSDGEGLVGRGLARWPD